MTSRKWRFFGLTGFIAFAALATSFLGYGPLSPAPEPAGDELLGLSPAEVLKRFGVPEVSDCSAHDITFSYPSVNGTMEPAIRFHENCAYWVKSGFAGTAQPVPAPTSGIYPGQPVQEMVKRVGSPDEILYGGAGVSLTLKYGAGMKIDVIHGLVIHVDAGD